MRSVPALPHTIHVLERGWLSSNNVVFLDDAAASVVDTGYYLHAEQTAQLIERVRAGRPLRRIVCTHLHSDHVGGNAALQARHAATITIPSGLAAAVDRWDVDALSYGPTGQHCPRFRYDAVMCAGDVISLGGLDWEVLAASGHDPHMVMLFNDTERLLISADALWENGFGVIFPEIEGESGFEEQRAALESIARRRPRLVIPGHGSPFADVDGALNRAFARLDALAASPERNARHVLKVLVKFWLMQVQNTTRSQLLAHFGAARYFRVVHQRYFAMQSFTEMIDRALHELTATGAATVADERIGNLDG